MENIKNERENPPFKLTTKPIQPFSEKPQVTLQLIKLTQMNKKPTWKWKRSWR